MALLRLYFETISKTLAGGLNLPLGMQLPALRQEEALSLNISVITQISQFTAPLYELKNLAGCSCRVSIGTAASVLASATPGDFTVDSTGTAFSGTLQMNTSGINALTDRQAGVYFEILITEASGATYGRRFPVAIEKAIYTSGTTVAPAGDVALGKLEAGRLYVKKEGAAGEGFILVSPDGTRRGLVYWGDDNALHAEPIT